MFPKLLLHQSHLEGLLGPAFLVVLSPPWGVLEEHHVCNIGSLEPTQGSPWSLSGIHSLGISRDGGANRDIPFPVEFTTQLRIQDIKQEMLTTQEIMKFLTSWSGSWHRQSTDDFLLHGASHKYYRSSKRKMSALIGGAQTGLLRKSFRQALKE